METLTNIASSATSTVSNLIYGQPAKNNETAGKEPLSGQQGKGTVEEPFDQGNAESQLGTSSSSNINPDSSKNWTGGNEPVSGEHKNNTSYKSDDFLNLSPAVGKSHIPESANETKTGHTSETAMPIVPLNPDVAMSGGISNTSTTSHAGTTGHAGATDTAWKETALDEIKPSGAPGAGSSAPDYTPAVPESYQGTSTSGKEHVSHETAAVKPHSTTETSSDATLHNKGHVASEGSSVPKKEPVSEGIDAIIHPTPKAEHSVDDAEADDPHSKMASKTVHHTEADKPSTASEAKGLVAEEATHKHVASKTAEPTSHTTAEEKDSKMSGLKDKLKHKLHIGSKDK